MAIYHVNLGFAEFSDTQLDAFAENVIDKLAGAVAAYPDPTVPVVDLQDQLETFTAALAAAADGGKALTATKDIARAALVDSLRKDAAYVQVQANNSLPVLLSSGYTASSTNRTSTTLATPNIESVENGISTTLVARVTPIRNARSYEVQVSSNNGTTWTHSVTVTRARPITIPGLTPGTTYQVQVRAVGGATGYSGWSNPVGHMAI